MDEAVLHAGGSPAASRHDPSRPVLSEPFRGPGSVSAPEMSQTGLMVPDMNEPLGRYIVTVTIGCDGSYLLDPAGFTEAAHRAAWSRSASIINALLADKIISVVTVIAPDRYAAAAVGERVILTSGYGSRTMVHAIDCECGGSAAGS